jgi:hypothetical protein
MSVPTSLEDLIAEVKALGAEDLISLFRALGMSRVGDSHTADCLSRQGSGLICDCVPDEPTWTQPKILTDHFGESWELRLAAAQERTRRRQAAGLE